MEMVKDLRAKASTGIHKAQKVGQLFGEGFKQDAASDVDVSISLLSGIWAGLKYKGSIKNGIKAGGATYLAFRCTKGLQNVVKNWREVEWTK